MTSRIFPGMPSTEAPSQYKCGLNIDTYKGNFWDKSKPESSRALFLIFQGLKNGNTFQQASGFLSDPAKYQELAAYLSQPGHFNIGNK